MGQLGDQIQGIIGQVFDNTLIPGLEVAEDVTLEPITRGTPSPTSESTGVSYGGPYSKNVVIREFTTREVAQSDGMIIQGDLSVKVFKDTDITSCDDGTKMTRTLNSRLYLLQKPKETVIDGKIVFWTCIARGTK